MLLPSGWKYDDDDGELADGQPRCKGEDYAGFQHSQPLGCQDVVRLRVNVVGDLSIGFAGETYEAQPTQRTQRDGPEDEAAAWVDLGDGSTRIYANLSQDGDDHLHDRHLAPCIPEVWPFDVAMRCDAADGSAGNVPQIQFNDDGVWHDFAPGRAALKAGPWFLLLMIEKGDRLAGLRVDRPAC